MVGDELGSLFRNEVQRDVYMKIPLCCDPMLLNFDLSIQDKKIILARKYYFTIYSMWTILNVSIY
jgi:hypothetical protein